MTTTIAFGSFLSIWRMGLLLISFSNITRSTQKNSANTPSTKQQWDSSECIVEMFSTGTSSRITFCVIVTAVSRSLTLASVYFYLSSKLIERQSLALPTGSAPRSLKASSTLKRSTCGPLAALLMSLRQAARHFTRSRSVVSCFTPSFMTPYPESPQNGVLPSKTSLISV